MRRCGWCGEMEPASTTCIREAYEQAVKDWERAADGHFPHRIVGAYWDVVTLRARALGIVPGTHIEVKPVVS